MSFVTLYITAKPTYNGTTRDRTFFSVEGRLYLIQVFEFWILDTVKFSPLRQVSLLARVRLREVSLRNYIQNTVQLMRVN